MSAGPAEIAVRGGTIRLGQMLKLAGIVGSGAEGKELLATGAVSVNGVVEERRGRRLVATDRIRVGDDEIVVGTIE